ncbi:uncharacterized protein aunip [Pholidichthys leucotaenia]
MKNTKAAPQTSAQEECGIWLDTVQLKGKAKQKRLTRPISKLLNPLAEGRGYSLAVALNFTQTKIEMPKTKQSSISTFFTPHRRVLNKMSTSQVPNTDHIQPPSSSSTIPKEVVSDRKRGRDTYFEMSDLAYSEPLEDHQWKSENVIEAEGTQFHKQTNNSPSHNVDCEPKEESEEKEFDPPQSKRRLTDTHMFPGDSQARPQPWSQDPLFTWSQYSENLFYPTTQKDTTEKKTSNSEMSFLNNLQNEEGRNREGTALTQKSSKNLHSSEIDDEKENNILPSKNSPKKHPSLSLFEPLSNHKYTDQQLVSPQKSKNPRWKMAAREENLDSLIKRAKPDKSPLKKRAPQQNSGDVDEDSLATLFTQDSEGFRVIAHRGLQARSPLKDQSNVNVGMVRTSASKPLMEEEEEDEMLFTQDSQGNMVIKH